jgi:hypothetical protein
METPIGLEPPVYGPDTPILMGSAANADTEAAKANAVIIDLILLFIISLLDLGNTKIHRNQPTTPTTAKKITIASTKHATSPAYRKGRQKYYSQRPILLKADIQFTASSPFLHASPVLHASPSQAT